MYEGQVLIVDRGQALIVDREDQLIRRCALNLRDTSLRLVPLFCSKSLRNLFSGFVLAPYYLIFSDFSTSITVTVCSGFILS